MTTGATISAPPGLRQAQITRRIFMGVFALGIGVWMFSIFNTSGLPNRNAAATVVGKEYVSPGSTYVTKIIDGRAYTVSQPKAEMYVLMLDIEGEPSAAVVEKAQYESVNEKEKVQVTYQRRRFTGGLQVVDVRR